MITSNATTMLSTAQVCVNNNLEYHQPWEDDGNDEKDWDTQTNITLASTEPYP